MNAQNSSKLKRSHQNHVSLDNFQTTFSFQTQKKKYKQTLYNLNYKMNHKYRTDILQKSGHANSPYIQLLEAKKKFYGYKYQIIKHDKNNPTKKVSHTIAHNLSSNKNKSSSMERSKHNKSQGSNKKKRVHTQQCDEKMHQSMFIPYHNQKITHTHQASKSLFYPQNQIESSPKRETFPRSHDKVKNKKIESSKRKSKSKSKSKSDNVDLYKNLNDLKLTDINSLIDLIENCIQESNDYISYLSGKVDQLKIELHEVKLTLDQSQSKIKSKTIEMKSKNHEIEKLKREVEKYNTIDTKKLATNQVQKLVEVIQKLNQQNNFLKKKIEVLSEEVQNSQQKRDMELFNEIHSKIDILNISIDSKGSERMMEHKEQQKRGKHRNKF